MVPFSRLRPAHRAVHDGDLDFPLEIDEEGVNEILVHGVGGATPEEMLGEAPTKQITGDRISGMWRGPDHLVDAAPRWHREAYSWGGLTSRALVSALWLLLAPFAVFNIAGWMAIGPRWNGTGGPDWRIAFQQALVRVIALAGTWTYVLFVAQISMDLGTWQCTQISRCRIGGWPDLVNLPLHGYPGRAVVLASLVPLLLLGALYVLTKVSVQRYEGFPVEPRRTGPVDLTRIRLTDGQFWSGTAYANLSRWLHLISSTVLVAWLLAEVARKGGRFSGATDVLDGVALAVLSIALVGAGWQGARNVLLGGTRRVAAAGALALALLGTAAALAWVQPRSANTDPALADPGIMPGVLNGFNGLVLVVYAVGLLHGIVAASGRWALGRDPVRPPRMPAPFTTIALGAWLLFAVWVGAVIWVARWLSPSAKTASGVTAGHLVYTAAYPALAQLSLVGVVLVLIVVLGFVWWCRQHRGASLEPERAYWAAQTLSGPSLRASWPAGPPPDGSGPENPADVAAHAPNRWLASVRRTKWWTCSAIAWIEVGLGWIALLATLGSIGFSMWLGRHWLGPTGLARVGVAISLTCLAVTVLSWVCIRTDRPEPVLGRYFQRVAGWSVLLLAVAVATAVFLPVLHGFAHRPPATDIDSPWVPREGFASAVLSLIPLASVLLLRQAFRNTGTRRLLGIAWDIATFWPRSFHPLAPPSYAERAVPELELRVRHLLGAGQAVLLLGHSQGAVLVTATLARLHNLPPAQGRRLAAATYGSPVRRLYMRWFPTYVDSRLVSEMLHLTDGDVAAGPRLVNFYRHTDPIGGPVFAPDPVREPGQVPVRYGDCWLPDPPTDRYRPGNAVPRIRGHSHQGYVSQWCFAEHIEREVRRLDATVDRRRS